MQSPENLSDATKADIARDTIRAELEGQGNRVGIENQIRAAHHYARGHLTDAEFRRIINDVIDDVLADEDSDLDRDVHHTLDEFEDAESPESAAEVVSGP
jgi:hypothetical protein